MKQTARLNDEPLKARAQRPPTSAPHGALVPSRVSAIPIEPPHPDEVADKLEFRNAAQYKRAIALAERYYLQARFAIDRRAASVKKAERQAQVDHEETASNYQRQLFQARLRYRQLLEQVHAKHRQAVFQARTAANRSEEVFKEVLKTLPGYGEHQLKLMALHDGRAVTHALVQAYKSALGPDAMGDMSAFLYALDKMIDVARDRKALMPLQFADALVKAVLHRQVRRAGKDKDEVDRLRQAAGVRLTAIQGFFHEQKVDATPTEIREVYLAVHDWLAKAAGTPFDLALDRLKLDVDSTVRKEQKRLTEALEIAAPQMNRLHEFQPVFEAHRQAQRVLIATEQAAKNVLNNELARIQAQFDKDVQLADAMVIGMDHTAAQRLAEAKRMLGEAKKMVGRWGRELEHLQELPGWQKLVWRLTEGFDHEEYWVDFRAKLQARL